MCSPGERGQSGVLPLRNCVTSARTLTPAPAPQSEYALRTAAVKAEPLEIIYSYYNGTGHRRAVTVRKGDTIGQFLKAVIEQLMPQFREVRTASPSSLMYVKEDIIMPQNITFYELIVNRAMGKSGPLFQFDLHEHAAVNFDPRVKSQDSHAGARVGWGGGRWLAEGWPQGRAGDGAREASVAAPSLHVCAADPHPPTPHHRQGGGPSLVLQEQAHLPRLALGAL